MSETQPERGDAEPTAEDAVGPKADADRAAETESKGRPAAADAEQEGGEADQAEGRADQAEGEAESGGTRREVTESDEEDLAQGYVPDTLLPDDLQPELNPLAASPDENGSREDENSSSDTDGTADTSEAQQDGSATGEASPRS
jgi:hypothetical protein